MFSLVYCISYNAQYPGIIISAYLGTRIPSLLHKLYTNNVMLIHALL